MATIAAKTQRWRAEQDAEDSGHNERHDQRRPELLEESWNHTSADEN